MSEIIRIFFFFFIEKYQNDAQFLTPLHQGASIRYVASKLKSYDPFPLDSPIFLKIEQFPLVMLIFMQRYFQFIIFRLKTQQPVLPYCGARKIIYQLIVFTTTERIIYVKGRLCK